MGPLNEAMGKALGYSRRLAGGSRPGAVGTQGAAGFFKEQQQFHGLIQPKKPLKTTEWKSQA